MTVKRKRRTAKLKFEVALEAAKGTKTINQIASGCGLHPSQVSQWKGQLLEQGVNIFKNSTARQQREQAALEADLYEQIGRLKMELEWLKKRFPGQWRSSE